MDKFRNWPRMRAVLRVLAPLCVVAISLGMAVNQAPGWWLWLFLASTPLLPLLWPETFSRWTALAVVLVAGALPALGISSGWLPVETSAFWYILTFFWLLAAWLLLPATLLLLLWRRQASPYVILLGMAVTPLATLLSLTSMSLVEQPSAESLAPAASLLLLVQMLPLWLVMWACSLGPLAFLGSLLWLVIQEVRVQTPPAQQTPPAIS